MSEEKQPIDQELAEEIEAGKEVPRGTEKPKRAEAKPQEKPKVGGFVKSDNPQESTYNGENLWTLSYQGWFDILTMLLKGSQRVTGTNPKDLCIDGKLLWTSSWDEKYAFLLSAVK